MAMGGVASGMVSEFYNGTQWPMIIVMVMCTVMGLAVILIGRSIKKYRALKHGISDPEPVAL